MRYLLCKSLMVLLFIHRFSDPLSAQTVWFKPGEVFYYDVRTGFDSENYGIHSMTYVKDTLINGYIFKALKYTDKKGAISDIFIQQEGEKVRNYTPVLNQFNLMYDFTALPGDPSPIAGYTIETTGTIEIENTMRKTQTWKNDNQRVLVIEGIGMVGDPNFTSLYVCSPPVPSFGCTGAWDGYDFYFRCMKSSDLHFDPYGSCTNSNTNQEELVATIYPNPTHHTFTIKSSRGFDEYRIYDQTGQQLHEETFSTQNKFECLIYLRPSLYYLRLYAQGTLITTKKLIILPTP